jgi:predicted nuclease of restriction endonuclease-like (RecB) superfamily
MNYYNEIKNQIINEEIYNKTKDFSKERHKVITYFEIGKLLNKAGGKYGENVIYEYSKRLSIEFGKKYNKRTLFRMRQFYNIFSNSKVSTLSTQLTWSHYSELLSLDNPQQIQYYVNLCEQQNLNVRTLRYKITTNEYERLPIETRNKINTKEKLKVKNLIPNPIIIKNQNKSEVINEKILHQLILEDISSFMKELGNNYAFIDSEYKIKLGDRFNYLDLLLYNIEFDCYVVVELKVTELKKEHIGQIQVYMNYIDANLKKITQDKTIGIIICKKNNKFIMEYCSDERILTREYLLNY